MSTEEPAQPFVGDDAAAGTTEPAAPPAGDQPHAGDDPALGAAEDATAPGGIAPGEAGEPSTVTDLPEGADVDPLTDQRPEPVVEAEPEDGQ